MNKNISKETEEEKKVRETIESIAENIEKLSRSVYVLVNGKLKKKSLIILLAHSASLPQYQVEKVLDAIVNLEKDHLKI